MAHKAGRVVFSARNICQVRPLILTRKASSNHSEPQFSVGVSDDLVNEDIFTQEHVELRRSLKKLIESEINPHTEEWEKNQSFPAHDVIKSFGKAGFLGINKPTEFGGLGLDYSFQLAYAEELGSIKPSGVQMCIGVQTDVAIPALAKFGSDELRKKFLAPAISGDVIGCLGVSEVNAGSDVAAIKTTAHKDGDDYIINGGKMWTTNGMNADWMCILANTGDGNPHKNKSLIIVPTNSKGFTRTLIPNKLGMRSSDTAQSFFDDVRVPQSYRIGEEGMGFIYQMWQFQEERMFGNAACLLQMERMINDTIKYCRERVAFGKPILNNQVVHFRLAELQTEIELVRSMVYRAAGLYMNGNDIIKFASMLKLKTGRLQREVADACLQYWGGMGYTDIDISRGFRDARLWSIGGGADEVMLTIISRYMGTFPSN